MSADLELMTGGVELVDAIETMWRKLTLHASHRSEHFPQFFAQRTFQQRREELMAKAGMGDLRIDIARDRRSGLDLGYCISSVDGRGNGEIESLFVDEISRGQGVGDALMCRAIDWMEEQGAASIAVFTVHGSDDVLPFYARYGFRPKMVMLERNKDRTGAGQR